MPSFLTLIIVSILAYYLFVLSMAPRVVKDDSKSVEISIWPNPDVKDEGENQGM